MARIRAPMFGPLSPGEAHVEQGRFGQRAAVPAAGDRLQPRHSLVAVSEGQRLHAPEPAHGAEHFQQFQVVLNDQPHRRTHHQP
ncbi:MAG: hypothetical protein M5R40_22265 [Anaerolineae bacterium]|nr:hypothetical protein [Anaerolineae bacterium]